MMMTVGLEHYLVLAAVLFAVGLYGALTKRSAMVILMCIEIMLNAVNITLVAFSRFITPVEMTGQLFAIFSIVVAAAEVTVGLAIIIAIYRHFEGIDTENINLLKW
jgi:NADH:ubiquinone oxidoreductase subunit K